MKIFDRTNGQIPQATRGVGLGFFDGVHCGHQELLKTLAFECQRQGLQSCVFTFSEHPEAVLAPKAPFKSYLVSLDQRLRLMADCGVDETYLQTFDSDFAAIDPLDFLNRYLCDFLGARLVVVGQDYRFGHKGLGDVALLRQWAGEKNIQVVVIGEVSMLGSRVSSSRIRQLINAGDFDRVQSLLGRPYSLEGEVVTGRKIGRKLGFPTANIKVSPRLSCPSYGVYATRTRVGDRTYPSITNVGLRPTVNKMDSMVLAETYIYHADIDLYGRSIKVEFMHRVRPEIRFDSLLQLGAQIKQDLNQVQTWHEQSEQCYERARIGNIPVYVMNTDRFASAQANLVFQMPMAKHETSSRALLMRILTASCKRYPSRIELASALDSLYGSSIDAHLEKQGDMQVINLIAESLVRWTDSSSPFLQTCDLLFDVLLDPLVDEEGLFDLETVESERRNLISELIARQNDRSKYAYDRCMELFCGDQIQQMHAYGEVKALQDVTRQDLRAAYDQLLTEASITLYIAGNIDQPILDICYKGLQNLPASERPVYRPGSFPSPFDPEAPAGLVEHRQVEQTRIVLAYNGLCPYFSHRSAIVTVLNSMLGGDVHSLLFDVVREKMGLAYSVFSMSRRSLQSIFILAGVDSQNTDEALKAIRRQIGRLASGDFADDLMDRSKKMINSAIRAIGDDISSLLANQINGDMMGRQMRIQDADSMIQSVTKGQITQMAASLRLVSCFCLTDPTRQVNLESCGLDPSAILESEG